MKKIISIVSAIAMVATMATSFVSVSAGSEDEFVGSIATTSAVATKLTASQFEEIAEEDLAAGMVPYKVEFSLGSIGDLTCTRKQGKYSGRKLVSAQLVIPSLKANDKVNADYVWLTENAFNSVVTEGFKENDYTLAYAAAAVSGAYPLETVSSAVRTVDGVYTVLMTLNTEKTVTIDYEMRAGVNTYTSSTITGGENEAYIATGTITFGEAATLDKVKIADDAVRNMKVGGDNITLEAKAYNTDEAENTAAKITWSSDTPAVATVDATTGVVTAVAEGTAVITATAKDGEITKTASVTVNVAKADPKLAKIEVSGANTVEAESTITLTATGKDQYGEDIAADFTWESDDTTVATVVNGVVTGVSEGTAKITAKSGSVVSDEFEVTVTAKAPTGPSFEGDGAGTQVKGGENVIGYVWPSAKIKNFKAGKYSITFTAGEDSTKRGLSFDAIDTNGDVGFVVVLNTSKGSVSMTIGYDAE